MWKDVLKDALDRVGALGLAEKTARVVRERTTAFGRDQRAQRERLVRFYAQLMGDQDLVFDVGAHMGMRTEAFVALGARVVAFEPQAHCARRLYRHFGSNPRVTILNKALDAAPGEKVLHGTGSSATGSLSEEWMHAVQASGRFAEGDFAREEVVRTTTLDAVIAVFGSPRFCKIDVEGFEYNVLRGLSRPIEALSLEVTPETFATTVACLDHLTSLGTYEFNFSSGDTLVFDLPRWLPKADAIAAMERMIKAAPMLYGDVYGRVVA